MQALRKHNSEWNLSKDQKKLLKSHVRALAGARSPAQFASWITQLLEYWENQNKPVLARYLKRTGGFFDPSSAMSHWYWLPETDPDRMDVAWVSQSNSGLESLNARIKSLIFSRFLHGFRASLAALLGRGVRNFSISGISLVSQVTDYSRYILSRNYNKKCPSTATRMLEAHFLCDSRAEGDTYVFHEDLEDPREIMRTEHNPFQDGIRIITFIPKENSLINAMPNKGGPICTCFEYRRTNVCLHVAILIQRERGFSLNLVLGERVHGQRELKIVSNGECLRRLPKKRKKRVYPTLVVNKPTTRSQSSGLSSVI
jgi:hypothetical protein